MENVKKEISAEAINAFCEAEFGKTPKNMPEPKDVYRNCEKPLDEKFIEIARTVYGQALHKEDAGPMCSRFEMFISRWDSKNN